MFSLGFFTHVLESHTCVAGFSAPKILHGNHVELLQEKNLLVACLQGSELFFLYLDNTANGLQTKPHFDWRILSLKPTKRSNGWSAQISYMLTTSTS